MKVIGDLDELIYKQIVTSSKQGNEYLGIGQFTEAISAFQKALNLLPNPIEQWEAATWLLVSIGEAFFFQNEMPKALDYLNKALYCPGAIGNPFIHLLLGKTYYALGNFYKASDELVRAYMTGGWEIFEDEDEKYISLVRKSIKV